MHKVNFTIKYRIYLFLFCLNKTSKINANLLYYFSELSSKLQDTLEMIEEALDVALSKTCGGFDEKHYEKVQTAYRLLGKTQVWYCLINSCPSSSEE